VLVVGYGNRLRTDDGFGWHAIEHLAKDPRVSGADLLWRHQLTPELAVDFAQASLVILVDASADVEPGAVAVRLLEPAVPDDGTLMSHHIDPGNLLALAIELYDRAPPVYVVGVGPFSMDDGDRISPGLERVMPQVVDVVAEIVAHHGQALHELKDNPEAQGDS
jgi:hydrogenase maturation protease